jgi:hypothetical protein
LHQFLGIIFFFLSISDSLALCNPSRNKSSKISDLYHRQNRAQNTLDTVYVIKCKSNALGADWTKETNVEKSKQIESKSAVQNTPEVRVFPPRFASM